MPSPLIEKFYSSLTPFRLYQQMEQRSEISFFLDSHRYRKPDQRYSYLGFDPFLEIRLEQGQVKLTEGKIVRKYPDSQWINVLRKTLNQFNFKAPFSRDFFMGGAVGYLGYETAGLFEKIKFHKKPEPGIPTAYFAFYQDVIIYDHKLKHYWLAARNREGTEKLREIFEKPQFHTRSFTFKSFRPEISETAFHKMVRRAKEYIAAGDIYQANLSQRFSFRYQGSPLTIYEKLRAINPSPFSSFLKIRELHLVSSSPERLILKKGRSCETRPIAGTHPRRIPGKSAALMKRALLASEKERAEHIMLVDLERNDLGRVCDYRSVKVREMMVTEKYSHVIHIVSKISGRLKQGQDAFDLIQAVFPGGTITGCPKVRCMQIIEELEKKSRGIYTGSLGYLDFKGDMDLNIIIRTLIFHGGKGYLQVGAGIVYDSDENREYEETLYKGEALKEALLKASKQDQRPKT